MSSFYGRAHDISGDWRDGQGRQVVAHLLAEGHPVRALTRDPAKAAFPPTVEVVRGDLTDPSSIPFDGVVGMHLLTWAPSLHESDEVHEPFGDIPAAMIDEADVGAVSAAVLTSAGHAGKAYALTGPEPLTPRQRLATLAAATGRDLHFVELTEEQARDRWRTQGMAPEMIDLLAGWQGNPPPHAYTVTDTVRRLLGRAPRALADWAAEHAANFART